MLSVLILAVKAGVWEKRSVVPRDPTLTKVVPLPPLGMPMIMGVMAAVFRLYQVIRWGLEVALAVAANGERVAAGAKRAPAPADAVATVAAALAAGVRVGVGGGEEDAVNFYVLYIYICQEL